MHQAIIRLRTLVKLLPIAVAGTLVAWLAAPHEGALFVAFSLFLTAFFALPACLLVCLITTIRERRLTARRFVIFVLGVGGYVTMNYHEIHYPYMRWPVGRHGWRPGIRREVDWVSTGLTALSLATVYILIEPFKEEEPHDEEEPHGHEAELLEHPLRDRGPDG